VAGQGLFLLWLCPMFVSMLLGMRSRMLNLQDWSISLLVSDFKRLENNITITSYMDKDVRKN